MKTNYFTQSSTQLFFVTILSLWLTTHQQVNAASNIEKCSSTIGTITINEPRGGTQNLQSFGIGSPNQILRVFIQESDCFDIVERGETLNDVQKERALTQTSTPQTYKVVSPWQASVPGLPSIASSSSAQSAAPLGATSADFILTPSILIQANQMSNKPDAFSSALASSSNKRISSLSGAVGEVVGGIKFKEAQTSLLVTDVKRAIQVAAAQSRAKQTEFGLASSGNTDFGGFTSSTEGKIIAASLLDNFNTIVIQLRKKEASLKAKLDASNQTDSKKSHATSMNTINIGFSGEQNGTVSISFDEHKNLQGFGNHSSEPRFALSGKLDDQGNLLLVGILSSGVLQFTGKLDPNTGIVYGTWTGFNGKTGQFTGIRAANKP